MNLESHLSSLTTKHASLEQAIAEEQLRPRPDDGILSRLKREKLKVKEELARLEHQ